jgi:hypothetical protein
LRQAGLIHIQHLKKPGAIRAFFVRGSDRVESLQTVALPKHRLDVYSEAKLIPTTTKVQWRRLLLLIPRLAALVVLGRLAIDWLPSGMPAYAGLAQDLVGVLIVSLLVVLVAVPALEACGVKVDRSMQQDGTVIRWAYGLALLAGILIGLDRLRYFLKIDAVPLHDRIYNVLIGLIAAGGYGMIRYLVRRKPGTK